MCPRPHPCLPPQSALAQPFSLRVVKRGQNLGTLSLILLKPDIQDFHGIIASKPIDFTKAKFTRLELFSLYF